MTKTEVFFYKERDGVVPVLAWLDDVSESARDKIFYRIRRLEESGHNLRRPEADFLRDGIIELRVRRQNVNYRVLYFFHKKEAVLAHGCTKEGSLDDADIDRAVQRKRKYQADPEIHRYATSAG